MASQIELSCEPDGRWIAELHVLPGLQLYGNSQAETLAAARTLTAMLLYESNGGDQRILAFYPGRIPDSAHLATESVDRRPSRDFTYTEYDSADLVIN
jgi:hypothetical protein